MKKLFSILLIVLLIPVMGLAHFNATLYVNLQPVTGSSSLLASNSVIWRYYNVCDGQFGQCEQRAVGAGNQTLPQSFIFDYSKEYITIECAIGDPKRVEFRGYYLVQGCDVDDPCGRAQRLPRKPIGNYLSDYYREQARCWIA